MVRLERMLDWVARGSEWFASPEIRPNFSNLPPPNRPPLKFQARGVCTEPSEGFLSALVGWALPFLLLSKCQGG